LTQPFGCALRLPTSPLLLNWSKPMSYEDFVVWTHKLLQGKEPTAEQWILILVQIADIRPVFANALFVSVEWVNGTLIIERTAA